MTALRLQGHDASPTQNFWVGLSHLLPGGGAEMSASPLERVYVVLSGGGDRHDIGRLDGAESARFLLLGAGETRSIVNASNLPASMLVIMPYPEGARNGASAFKHAAQNDGLQVDVIVDRMQRTITSRARFAKTAMRQFHQGPEPPFTWMTPATR